MSWEAGSISKHPFVRYVSRKTFLCSCNDLVDLQGTKNGFIEPQTRRNSNESGHEEEANTSQTHVTKIQGVGSKRVGLQLLEVDKGVQEDVD